MAKIAKNGVLGKYPKIGTFGCDHDEIALDV
jgi:hypothetical protein